MKKVYLIAISSLLITSIFSPPVLAADLILDGAADFTNLTGDSRYVGTASYTDKLNTNGTGIIGGLHTGFESFFTSIDSSFGRLGTTTDSTLSPFTSGITQRVSKPFQFSETALLNPTQIVQFDYAFDGNGISLVDNFVGFIASSSNPAVPISGLVPTGLAFTNPGGQRNANFSVSSSLLKASTDYVLTFQLLETDDAGVVEYDSGAAFDNVRVSNARAVPFEFSPGIGIIALGICGILIQFKNTIKNQKNSKLNFLANNK